MKPNEKDSARITELEFALMHLQKDFESLNEMVLKGGKRLDEMKLLLQRLSDRLDASLEAPEAPEERSLEDERPPHY